MMSMQKTPFTMARSSRTKQPQPLQPRFVARKTPFSITKNLVTNRKTRPRVSAAGMERASPAALAHGDSAMTIVDDDDDDGDDDKGPKQKSSDCWLRDGHGVISIDDKEDKDVGNNVKIVSEEDVGKQVEQIVKGMIPLDVHLAEFGMDVLLSLPGDSFTIFHFLKVQCLLLDAMKKDRAELQIQQTQEEANPLDAATWRSFMTPSSKCVGSSPRSRFKRRRQLEHDRKQKSMSAMKRARFVEMAELSDSGDDEHGGVAELRSRHARAEFLIRRGNFLLSALWRLIMHQHAVEQQSVAVCMASQALVGQGFMRQMSDGEKDRYNECMLSLIDRLPDVPCIHFALWLATSANFVRSREVLYLCSDGTLKRWYSALVEALCQVLNYLLPDDERIPRSSAHVSSHASQVERGVDADSDVEEVCTSKPMDWNRASVGGLCKGSHFGNEWLSCISLSVVGGDQFSCVAPELVRLVDSLPMREVSPVRDSLKMITNVLNHSFHLHGNDVDDVNHVLNATMINQLRIEMNRARGRCCSHATLLQRKYPPKLFRSNHSKHTPVESGQADRVFEVSSCDEGAWFGCEPLPIHCVLAFLSKLQSPSWRWMVALCLANDSILGGRANVSSMRTLCSPDKLDAGASSGSNSVHQPFCVKCSNVLRDGVTAHSVVAMADQVDSLYSSSARSAACVNDEPIREVEYKDGGLTDGLGEDGAASVPAAVGNAADNFMFTEKAGNDMARASSSEIHFISSGWMTKKKSSFDGAYCTLPGSFVPIPSKRERVEREEGALRRAWAVYVSDQGIVCRRSFDDVALRCLLCVAARSALLVVLNAEHRPCFAAAGAWCLGGETGSSSVGRVFRNNLGGVGAGCDSRPNVMHFAAAEEEEKKHHCRTCTALHALSRWASFQLLQECESVKVE